MFWHEWNLIQFICYSVILWFVSSAVTIYYTQKDAIEKIINKNLKIHKRTGKGLVRIFPPPHPGGPKSSFLDKEAARLILEEGFTKDSAWEKLKPDYINSEIEKNEVGDRDEQREYYRDPQNLKQLKENFYKRVNRIIGRNYS